LEQGVTFARFSLVDVNYTTTVSSPYNKYVTALRYQEGGYELQTTGDFKNFVREERITRLVRWANLYCLDGNTVVRVTFNIDIPDLNLDTPTFDKSSYEGDIQLPIDAAFRLDTAMIVTDTDLDPDNAAVTVTTDNEYFVPLVTPLWDAPYPTAYQYEVNFAVSKEVAPGTHSVTVTASDGVNESTATLEVLVRSPPEEEKECGFDGHYVGDVITLPDPIKSDIPVGTVIWRGTLSLVQSVITLPHAHNKYLRGVRSGDDYHLETTAEFSNFYDEQGVETLNRSVILSCNDNDDGLQYDFSFDIAFPEPEPTPEAEEPAESTPEPQTSEGLETTVEDLQ